MKILANYLKAMMLFAGKNDVRYYLNGVAIQADRMIATDGHRITVCRLPEDTGLDVIIPTNDIRIALMLVDKRVCGIAQDIEVTESTIGRLSYKSIEGDFPEWKKLIPKQDEVADVDNFSINPKYMADYARLSEIILRSKKYCAITMRKKNTEKNGAIIVYVSGCDDFFSLLMPVRFDVESVVPNWLQQEAA